MWKQSSKDLTFLTTINFCSFRGLQSPSHKILGNYISQTKLVVQSKVTVNTIVPTELRRLVWRWFTVHNTFTWVFQTNVNLFTPTSNQFQIFPAALPEYNITHYEELGFLWLTQIKADYTIISHYFTCTFLLKGDGRMYFLSFLIEWKGLRLHFHYTCSDHLSASGRTHGRWSSGGAAVIPASGPPTGSPNFGQHSWLLLWPM